MTTLDQNLCEQLSAYMDGELAADEARFLERRLANEPELRALWERMQIASSCIKGQPLRPMRATLPDDIATALAGGSEPQRKSSRPLVAWAVAASVALLALALVPQWFGAPAGPATTPIAESPSTPVSPVRVSATPASADLVSADVAVVTPTPAPPDAATVPGPSSATAPRASSAPVVATSGEQSPADFPLVEAAGSKAWPRSPLSSASNDPALEAYLVRHNQMMSDDGLSGFVPYVDVVANDPNAANQDDNGDAKQ